MNKALPTPPTPLKQIAARHINFGDHNALLVSVFDIEQLNKVAEFCAQIGKIEMIPNDAHSFYCHIYDNYHAEQIPALIEWVEFL